MLGVAFAGMVPPARLILPAPAVAVSVPPQALATVDGLATTRPAGKVSVKVAPVSAIPVGFRSVMLIVEVPPTAMLVGAKDLRTEALTCTFMFALAAETFVTPSRVEIAPIPMVLV